MCRMYASVGPAGPPVEELVAFRGLCKAGCGGPHADGWGIVGYRQPRVPEVLGKSTLAAFRDPAYEEAAARAPAARVVLAHLRKASVGGRLWEHTHPFTEGAWAMAHNGTIHNPYAQRMAPGRGFNDSQAFFRRALAHLRRDPVEALRAAVREVREGGFRYTSITVLLTDGEQLWAVRDVRERPEEYELHWQRRGQRVVLCQEPVLEGAWASLPNGSLAVAGPKGVEVLPL